MVGLRKMEIFREPFKTLSKAIRGQISASRKENIVKIVLYISFRFEKRIYIPLPDAPARVAMFQLHIGKTPHSLNQDNFKDLGKRSEG